MTQARRWFLLFILALLTACAVLVEHSVHAAQPGSAAAKSAPRTRDLETVAVVSDRAQVKAGDQVVATVGKGRMFGVLRREGPLLEVQVCVGTAVRRGWLHKRHVKFLTDDDVDLGHEWLKMSKALNPEMDEAACKARLDALVKRLVAAARGKTARGMARAIRKQLLEEEGFSFEHVMRLDMALDSKKGNSLALSLLHLCAARKLNMPLHLVAVPGHAFVRYDDGRERFDIETTDEKVPLSVRHPVLDKPRHRGMHYAALPDPRAYGALLFNWGIALVRMGEYAEACAKYAKAVELDPRHAVAYNNWGVALVRMGKYAEACAKYAKAVELDPRHAVAYNNWGKALDELGKYAEACAKFARAVEIDPRYAWVYYNWGNALDELGKYAEACAKYAKAVELDPRHVKAYNNWGNALDELGKYTEASAKFAKAIEIHPRFAAAYYNWGNALGALGKYAEASAKYARAVELDPRDAAAYSNWGNALDKLGKYAEACTKYARAVEIHPRYAAAYNNWGNALGELGKYAEACEKFAKAVEVAPRFTEAYSNWGYALDELGKYAEACTKYARAVEINPRLAAAYQNWAGALARMGNLPAARQKRHKAEQLWHKLGCDALVEALKLDGKDPAACYKRGMELARAGNHSEAGVVIGVSFALRGQHAAACDSFAEAAKSDPRSAAARLGWGISLLRMERRAEAREKLRRAAELDPALMARTKELRALLGRR